MPQTESALEDVRAEWVASSTTSSGDPIVPSNPSWNKFSDYIISYAGWSADSGVQGQTVVGNGDIEDHFRNVEEHDIALRWWMDRFFVDGSNNPNDPVGEIIEHDYQTDYPRHEVLIRRETGEGGNDGAGFREYIYGRGCRPSAANVPGAPDEGQPIIVEGSYACQKVRQYVIHQPSSSTTLDVTNNGSSSIDVTIEDEGASTTETITVSANTTATTTSSFGNVDAIWAESEPAGDITVTDGGGVTILEDEITGSSEDGVEGDRGVPSLGTGSHASSIGNTVDDDLFLNADATFGGSAPAQSPADGRTEQADLSLEVEMTRRGRQGTRRQVLDAGTRTCQVEVQLSGPYESAVQMRDYLRGRSADFVYQFDSGDVTLKNATIVDVDEVDREAGDAAVPFTLTYEAHGDAAISATNT